MLTRSSTNSQEIPSYVESILEIPERPELLRVAALAEYIFRVPVAYLAVLDHTAKVVTRIGSGSEYWPLLKTFPLAQVLEGPVVVRDAHSGLPGGANFGDLRFAASAPLVSSGGECLGFVVIADKDPRPNFLDLDVQALADLASTLSGKMELRIVASHARETELALHEAERRFRVIANSSPMPMICSGADGASTFVNRAWLEFTGRTIEEELEDAGSGVVHPDSRRIVYETYWRAFQARQPVTVEVPMRRHDGVYRWMLCRGLPRLPEDGTFAGFVATLCDITDRYEAVAEVQKYALCASAVATAAGLHYVMLDPSGRIEPMSPILQSGASPPAQSEASDFFWDTAFAVRCGTAAVREAVERAAASRSIVKFRTTDCEGGVVHWTIAPILTALGEVIALVATVGESAQTVTRAGAKLGGLAGRQTQTRGRMKIEQPAVNVTA